MAKFNLEILDERELLLLQVLLSFATTFFHSPYAPLAQRVAALSGARANTSPLVGLPAAVNAAAPAPVSPGPPARSKSAKKEPESDGTLAIIPVRVDQPAGGKSMVVHYQIRTAAGEKMKTIRCWDPSYFGTILDTVGQATTFLTKTNAQGFTNIVGVKR